MSRAAVVWTVLLILVTTAVPAAATSPAEGGREGTESDRATEAKPQPSPWVLATGGKTSKTAVKVYTNEDLARLAGGGGQAPEPSEPTPAAAEAPAPSAPPSDSETPTEAAPEPKSALDELFEQEDARREHARKIAEAEKRVATARQAVANAEKRLLEVRNPLLPRPAAPEEDAEAWNAADGAQRVEQSERMIQAARDALAEAERELADLRSSTP